MKRIFTVTLVCALVCFLTSCGAAKAETQQEASSMADATPSSIASVSDAASDSGSAAEEEYSVAFLNHEVTTIMTTITALENEMTSAKEFGPNIWDYVETYYADYENQCIWFCIYDTEIEDEICAALGNPDYLQFTYIEPATIQAQVLSCGEWNQETGRQPIQMVTIDSNEIFEAGQEISVRVESDAPLTFSEGEAVTVVHKISYDATDPPVVYAFSVDDNGYAVVGSEIPTYSDVQSIANDSELDDTKETCYTSNKRITLEDMCQDGTISIFGLNENSATSDFEETFGQSYEEYAESLEAAYDSGDFQSIMFSFEGKKACLSASFKNDTLQSVFINFLDEDLSEQDWKDFSDLVMDTLKTYSVSENQISRYFFHNAEIWLEFGPVDQSDYEVSEDGTTAWSGIVGEYGSKITEMRIWFKQ